MIVAASAGLSRAQAGVLLDCTIFMAEEIRVDTSVMLLGTIKVVLACAATWL